MDRKLSTWHAFIDPCYRVLVMNQNYQSWVPLRFLELDEWTTIWNGQDVSACRILDIVEEGETRDSWPVVDLFNVDGATTIGLYPDENVDRVQMFYRWGLPPENPEYECKASHDLNDLLPLAFPSQPSILYGTVDVGVSVSGLHVLDLPGMEILERVNLSPGIKTALASGPERRPSYCWRDVARKVLVNGGDPRNVLTIRVEVEGEEYRCEGIQCTRFLTLQAQMLMNARSGTSRNDRHAVIVGHSDKYVLQTLRRLLATIGAQSRKTSYIQDTGHSCQRTYYKLFWYPEQREYVDPRQDHGPTFTAFNPRRTAMSPPYCLVQFADKGLFLVDGVCYLPYRKEEPKLTGRPWCKPDRVKRRQNVR